MENSFRKSVEVREQLLEKVITENWSEEKQKQEAQRLENRLFSVSAFNQIDTYCHVKLKEIENRFGRRRFFDVHKLRQLYSRFG
jgi:transposase